MSRRTVYFDGEIGIDSVKELVSEIESYEEVDLYFSSEGGDVDAMNVLLHSLNNHNSIKLFLIGSICSVAAHVLIKFKGEKIITDSLDFIVVHANDRSTYNIRKNRYVDDKIILKQDIEYNNNLFEEFLKIGFTEEEKELYLQGEDVMLYKKDFHRLKL